MRCRSVLFPLVLALGLAMLSACSVHTDVSLTANPASQYTHVWITAQEVWFNTQSDANPDATAWLKFPLPTPVTIDLNANTSGTLSAVASQLRVPAGVYHSVRLVLADTASSATTSATNAGLTYNNEVDFTDSSGVAHQAPLRIANADKGIGISTSLSFLDNSALKALSANTAASTTNTGLTAGLTSTNTIDSGDGTVVAATSDTTGTSTATDTSTVVAAASSTSVSFSIVIDFDAARDLIPVGLDAAGTQSTHVAYLLNPHLEAFDSSDAGTIEGQVDLSALPTGSAVTVAAETLSADKTHYVVIRNATVNSDGTFVLYPLSTVTGAPTAYDIVVHGPNVQTTIVKSVPVSSGAPANVTTAFASAIPLVAASPFNVNLASAQTALPAGSRIRFYQTIDANGEVPYVIDERNVSPLSQTFTGDEALSNGSLSYAGYVVDATQTFTTSVPTQGKATYQTQASAPFYVDGSIGTPFALSSSTTTALITIPAAALPSQAATSTVSGALTSVAGKYDRGSLLLSHDGFIVAGLAIDTAVKQGSGSFILGSVPAGTSNGDGSAVYYASVWAWNSADPLNTLTQVSSATPVDTRSGAASGLSLQIN